MSKNDSVGGQITTPDEDLGAWAERYFDDVRPVGSGWQALCPAHDDQTPSLSIDEGEDGRILLKCHAGCPIESILEAAGLEWEDIFSEGATCRGSTACRTPRTVLSEEDRILHDRVYRSLLEQMHLSEEHRAHLRNRGLTDEEIDLRGYRTVDEGSRFLAPKPYGEFPEEDLIRVPGFTPRRERDHKGGPGHYRVLRFEGSKGIFIPFRDMKGRIISAQVRTFEPRVPKYTWLRGSKSIPHVPLGVKGPCQVVRVTEGPLKADVVFSLQPEIPTVAVAGTGSWKSVLPLLKALGPEEVRLAFDADWQMNPGVAQAVLGLGKALLQRGYQVVFESWDVNTAKGIDDLLQSGQAPEAVAFESVMDSLTDYAQPSEKGEHMSGANGTMNGVGVVLEQATTREAERESLVGKGPVVQPGRKVLSFPSPVPISYLSRSPNAEVTWIWDGFIPEQSIVLLTALWKSGKTTLLGHLLKAMSAGEKAFCGRSLKPCKVLIVTQEPDAVWNGRREEHNLSDEVVFFQRGEHDYPAPFRRPPNQWQWGLFIDHLEAEVKRDGFGLVVIDPLADFWPVNDENDASEASKALTLLRHITHAGASVLILHHPRKSGGNESMAHRGSGQIAAFPDVLIELHRRTDDKNDRTRVLKVTGRYQALADLVIELTDQGYIARGEPSEKASPVGDEQELDEIQAILPVGSPGLPVKELAEKWSRVKGKKPKTAERRLRDLLNRGVSKGLWYRKGTGGKNDARTYYRV